MREPIPASGFPKVIRSVRYSRDPTDEANRAIEHAADRRYRSGRDFEFIEIALAGGQDVGIADGFHNILPEFTRLTEGGAHAGSHVPLNAKNG